MRRSDSEQRPARIRPHPLLGGLRRGLLDLGLRHGRLLVAVSGGPDSVALLVGLRELAPSLGLSLQVATVDHQLRAGSAGDVAYVRALCKRLGIPFHLRKVRVDAEEGVEAGARRARYRALESVRRRAGLEAVVTAHTLEDQVETVLLRLGRGSGTRGLRGILPRRGAVARPLLEVSRAQVASFLRSRRLRPRQDPTNRSSAFARNRVRARVLPALIDALGESALEAIARAAQVALHDERLLERLARRKARALFKAEPAGALGASVADLKALDPALLNRVLRLAARQAGVRLSWVNLRAVLGALQSGRPTEVVLPDRVEFRARYGRCWFDVQRPTPHAEFECLIPGEGQFEFEQAGVKVRAVTGPGPAAPGTVRIDPARIALPLRLRTRRPGDRFWPRGGRRKKLKQFLIDAKLPREARERLVLLADSAGQVLWIVGVRAAEAAAEGERSASAWEIAVLPHPERRAADTVTYPASAREKAGAK